ncbi:cell division protein FtsW [Kocuria flava]|uniref:Probable peptidoglycan glycosyltransferase FtsW n=1 Tax=Kocuria flava TaxID=446860 RepID=A0A0U2YWK1_9MICC|nr:putative lipid II flippase FtsW [Kocuria flava]ALU39857.1 cell division protein FtsW [Kocuria flava]GEO91947.1 cell division protein FtsW [Kocuria flava]
MTALQDRPGVQQAARGSARGVRRFWRAVVEGPLIHSYYALAGSVLLLTAIGIMMVLSASAVESISAERSAYSYFLKQAVYAGLGVALMFALSFVPTAWYRRGATWLLGLAVALLGLVFTGLGSTVNGNRNWIVVGGQSFQPSEAAKLALCVWLAAVLARQGSAVRDWRRALWPSAAGFGVPVLMVALGQDMGTVLVFVLIYAAALFFAGAPLRLFGIAAAGAAVLGALAVATAPHRVDRITGWLFGECGATDACWQAQQGLNALASGGWWGVGLGQSRLKYNYVPEAHNDYIFSIIGEELGLLGTVLILALFALMALAMARVILRARDPFVRLATAGVVTWLVGQAFINIGMVTGVLPVIGVPLPFISYGGSSLMMSLAAVGVVMSFTRLPRRIPVPSGSPRPRTPSKERP